jgi:hypothetical protein
MGLSISFQYATGAYNSRVKLVAGVLVAAGLVCAQTGIMPLKAVKAGQRGVGRTVFAGQTIAEFGVEILGVLENAAPKQSIILGRLSGGPLEQAGVLQGMSGSPVYIDGKLAGAVAMAFAFAKEPIAGIRPIEEMLEVKLPAGRARLETPVGEIAAGGAKLVELATPLSMGGFTAATLEEFLPRLRGMGLEPMQGALAGQSRGGVAGGALAPGAMISVHLVTGDFNVAADGTVTHVEGNRVYAFGHRFLALGAAELPFSRAEVLTLLPALNTSFKISAAREPLGVITADYTAAIAGELGGKAAMVPATIAVAGRQASRYRLEIVRDRLLTPFLLQMALFSAIDATERGAGAATVTVKGEVELAGAVLKIDNTYAADNGAVLPASLAASVPLGYAMQSGFAELAPRRVSLQVGVENESRLLRVGELRATPAVARPGETVNIQVTLYGAGGKETREEANWRVPVGFPAGQLTVMAADALTTNVQDFGFIVNQPPVTLEQVLRVLNQLRANSTVNVRLLRAAQGYLVRGSALPSPPPSVAQLLRRNPAEAAPAAASKVAEFDFTVAGAAVVGSKSTQIEIKE